MQRYNLIQARGAEFTVGMEGIAIEGEGKDVIDLAVKRGKVSIIVPADLPDGEECKDYWFSQHTYIELELENGMHISGWVRGGESHIETA